MPGHYGMHLADEVEAPATYGFESSVNYRWLHSDRMFVHDVEQAPGNAEINDSHFIDLGVTYAFDPRFSATATLPLVFNDRSQVVRTFAFPPTIDRFHTQASGLADVRVEGNAWLLDPLTRTNGNVRVGLGVSAPTGDRDAQDVFELPGPTLRAQRHAVDQSIQPGAGGWGIILDAYAYREILPRLNAFLNGSYTVTPEEKYSPTASLMGDYSITDNYLARGGFEYIAWPRHALSLSLAGRIEGVPVHDLIGGSDGFRRPGYAVSIEPGVSLAFRSWSFALNVPVALYRNREQSVPEKAAGLEPAAAGFADYVVTFGVTRKF